MEVFMAVIEDRDIKFKDVVMDGVRGVRKANVVGAKEGWKDSTLRIFRLEAGGCTPHHQHDWEHVNYIMGGRGVLTIGDESREVSEGDFAFIPSNTVHQFRNPFEERFSFICIVPRRGA
jgi:quercetin dioxygenase-like cupin family protein